MYFFLDVHIQFFTPDLETPQPTWPYYLCPFVVCHSVTVSSWTYKNTQESVQRTGCLMRFGLLGFQCQDGYKIAQQISQKLKRHAYPIDRLEFGWIQRLRLILKKCSLVFRINFKGVFSKPSGNYIVSSNLCFLT